jgi:hypothetical protein
VINAYLEMSLVKMNVIFLTSTAMAVVLMLLQMKCGNAIMHAYLGMNHVIKCVFMIV